MANKSIITYLNKYVRLLRQLFNVFNYHRCHSIRQELIEVKVKLTQGLLYIFDGLNLFYLF